MPFCVYDAGRGAVTVVYFAPVGRDFSGDIYLSAPPFFRATPRVLPRTMAYLFIEISAETYNVT